MGKSLILRRIIGISGCACLSVASFGIWKITSISTDSINVERDTSKTLYVVEDYYPLVVGNYWIYSVEDPAEARFREVRRQIVSHERRDQQDVYFFEDGSLAYRQDGKVYEIDPEGQVNVVFASQSSIGDSYSYRSKGFHIEKRVSAVDTIITAGDRKYEKCLQIITSFRKSSASQNYSYASYFAPGIGLVGRQQLDNDLSETGTIELLKEFGSESM